ncbi:MAG: NAD-glutamate dehydrogenase, partial [Gammaproteobacteria bacterium]|nr:NAD-glutamate dehydrogenase [Gammaproteobacteria bacterium]
VFLGYRHYRLKRGRGEDELVADVNSGLGILNRCHGGGRPPGPTVLRGDVRARAREPELLVLTKANSTSTVHRGELLDYVGVKTFDSRGRVDGEHRFLGLWTSTAYHGSPRDIPVLRRKVERVIEHFGLDPASHDGKALLNVLETYPRDELFQAGVPDLIRIVRGVVNLYERRTVRLLVRRDPYHRFYSCLVYVPRDRYNTEVRQRIEKIALTGFAGMSVESHAQITGESHARLHVVVRTDPARRHKPDFADIEHRIGEAALTWADRLREVLVGQRGEEAGLALIGRYRNAFPIVYQEGVSPEEVLEDLRDLEALRAHREALQLRLHRPAGQRPQRVHLRFVRLTDPVPISDVLPMLENFGLRVISEHPYELAWPEGGAAWIQDFELEHRDGVVVDIARVEANFREAFAAAWSGAVENDGFNRLLLAAELSGRQIVMLRALCRYLLQTGVPFSQTYMERTLGANAAIARNLVRLFETRLGPSGDRASRRERNVENIVAEIRGSLDGVASLDDDRILRAYLTLIQATLRTNFFQPGADARPRTYVSFKFDPARIPDLPLPKPKFEIFVYSPRVEGVHLRMGHVARGGIRWSDRREDFRTEVLGLMKAQNVKNTLIVPVGAKGGFVPKLMPKNPTREQFMNEGIASYKLFIGTLLDITDNIAADGKIVPPDNVVRHEGDDPYLVVAADKGTASFSDIANGLAIEHGYWLGDAFASGGSQGYDHKAMGITARGAWEAVKRHFR